MKRVEAICDALANYHDYWTPESEAHIIRNPGMLPSDTGKRVFSCHRAGYAALLDRVQKHCEAHPEARIETLLEHFGIKMRTQQIHAMDYIARCTDSTITEKINLGWFLHE